MCVALVVAAFLIDYGRANAAENKFIKYIGNWQLFINRSNTCSIGATFREPDKSIYNFIISFPDSGPLSPSDALSGVQMDVQDSRIPPKPEAAGKRVILSIGDKSFGGAIAAFTKGKIIALFFPRSRIVAGLSKIGKLRISSGYFNSNMPLKPLHEQIAALVACEQARKKK
jgi:hypothetical protein